MAPPLPTYLEKAVLYETGMGPWHCTRYNAVPQSQEHAQQEKTTTSMTRIKMKLDPESSNVKGTSITPLQLVSCGHGEHTALFPLVSQLDARDSR